MKNILPKEYRYEEVDSTMDEAKRLISSGKITETSYVVAEYQTSGRGTRGRKWDSPKGAGIYLSIIHLSKKDSSMELTTLYTLAAGVACVESLREACNISSNIKPVNDLYVNSKKLGGILVESKIGKTGLAYLITGIGINMKKIERELDREEVKPISVEEILNGKLFSEEKLIKTVVNKVDHWYSFIFKGEHLKVQDSWNSYVIKN